MYIYVRVCFYVSFYIFKYHMCNKNLKEPKNSMLNIPATNCS